MKVTVNQISEGVGRYIDGELMPKVSGIRKWFLGVAGVYAGKMVEDKIAEHRDVLINAGITPVICAITHDGKGNLLNTNADTIASAIAVSLAKDQQPAGQDGSDGPGCEVSLIYCFEKNGVLYDKDDDSSVIPEITPGYYRLLKHEGRVAAGMIPKLDNAFSALENGVRQVVIKHSGNLCNGTGTVLTIRES